MLHSNSETTVYMEVEDDDQVNLDNHGILHACASTHARFQVLIKFNVKTLL